MTTAAMLHVISLNYCFIIITRWVPILGEIISVSDLYEIQDNNFNYYHYQPV